MMKNFFKRESISKILKAAAVLFSALGCILSFVNAKADGYSHFSKRLLYFTFQSNVWIAVLFALLLLKPYVKRLSTPKAERILFILRYVFTVSITLTGFIFCFVLAPGAKNDNYNAWTLSSLMTHVIVPTLSIADFFVDRERVFLLKRHIALTAIPPFLYAVFASILFFLNVDFGRGDNFPYFFFNYSSPAGFFGTSDVMPYIVGSFYWIVFILLIVLSLAAAYRLGSNRDLKTEKRK